MKPNMVHHDKPNYMITIPWYINNIANVVGAALFAFIIWLFLGFSWQLVVFFFFGVWTQQVHRFQHCPSVRLPRFVKFLQKYRVIQDARHHWVHHTDQHTSHYCILTPWLNPVLDRLGFWRGMERIFAPIFGAPRRPDLMAMPWYPDRRRG
ncbi:fatty acid desaturase CarF family protein [Nioella aestuarii]|uniref:fatty acid desaturase CarF family protein n=1 Tax=Nioella aestuarii TaxID=1662864 RepID=UPI003D7F52B6